MGGVLFSEDLTYTANCCSNDRRFERYWYLILLPNNYIITQKIPPTGARPAASLGRHRPWRARTRRRPAWPARRAREKRRSRTARRGGGGMRARKAGERRGARYQARCWRGGVPCSGDGWGCQGDGFNMWRDAGVGGGVGVGLFGVRLFRALTHTPLGVCVWRGRCVRLPFTGIPKKKQVRAGVGQGTRSCCRRGTALVPVRTRAHGCARGRCSARREIALQYTEAPPPPPPRR